MIKIKVRIYPIGSAPSYMETYSVPENTTFEQIQKVILDTRNVTNVGYVFTEYPST